MLAWYDDINSLIDKTADERNAFVTRHKRSLSTSSRASISSDGGLEEDEADRVPFSASQSVNNHPVAHESELPSRPSPGGRFPSDLQLDRSLQARGPSSGSSSEVGLDITAAAGGLTAPHASYPHAYDERTPMDAAYGPGNPYEYHPEQPPPQVQQHNSYFANNQPATPGQNFAANTAPVQPIIAPIPYEHHQTQPAQQDYVHHQRPVSSSYGEWMAPAAGGVAAGALGADALHRHQQSQEQKHEEDQINAALAAPEFTQGQGPASANPYDQTAVGGGIPNSTTHPASQIIAQHQNQNTAFVGAVPLSSQHAHADGADSLATTPSVAHVPFSNGAAAPVGGKMPMGNGDATSATMVSSPGAPRRTNTDLSVSDLHVPGEYPHTGR